MFKRQLILKLNNLHPVSKGYQNFIETENPFIYRKVKKGAFLLVPGTDARDLLFICKGLIKLYRFSTQAEERVTGLYAEDAFIMLPGDFYDGSKMNSIICARWKILSC